MKYSQITWDLETLYNKYKRGQLNLEADFQRGEVWSLQKRRKLVDTILRGWPIPPVQLLKKENGSYDVLDGLQRVSTIVKFINGEITIDAKFNPKELDDELHGKTFSDICNLANKERLEEKWVQLMNSIYGFVINVYEIHEASPEEIAELFDRFNAPMILNTVEKRNAFAGVTRNQMIELTEDFVKFGASANTLGFSNNRGSYLDLITKVCYTIEFRNTETKIGSDMLTDLYRKNYEFSNETMDSVRFAMRRLMDAIQTLERQVKLPRASVFSVLIFLCVHDGVEIYELQNILSILHTNNTSSKYFYKGDYDLLIFLRKQYDQATSFASTDVKSIKKRQYVLHILHSSFSPYDFSYDYHDENDEQRFEKDADAFGYLYGI